MARMVHPGLRLAVLGFAVPWFAVLASGHALLPAQKPAQRPVLVEVSETTASTIGGYLGLGDGAAVVDAHWMEGRWQDVVKAADEMIARDKADHHGHALKYLALLELKRDRMLATQAAVRATKDLGQSPQAMVEFIDRALYVNPRVNEHQLALMALVPMVADAPEVASVRIAHIRALMGCGNPKQALATARVLLTHLEGSTDDLLALAKAICEMKAGKPLGAVARQALDEVLKTRKATPAIRRLQYRILGDFEGQQKAAHELGVKIVAEGAKNGGLNNWVWNLMTRRSTAGKYPSLALLGARRLMQENPSAAELDTIALALFHNGLLDEALDFQERAVKASGGSASPGLQRRLGIFRAAKAKRDKPDK